MLDAANQTEFVHIQPNTGIYKHSRPGLIFPDTYSTLKVHDVYCFLNQRIVVFFIFTQHPIIEQVGKIYEFCRYRCNTISPNVDINLYPHFVMLAYEHFKIVD